MTAVSVTTVKITAADKRRIQNETRQIAWNEKVSKQREAILNSFADEKRKKFFLKGLETLGGDLFTSFKNQWNTYGKLSEKQIDIIVNAYARCREIETISDMFHQYKPGQEYEIRVILKKYEPDHVTMYTNGDQVVHSWFVFTSSNKQEFHLKTNNKKLIERLNTHFETHEKLTMKVKLKHVSPDFSRMYLESRPAPKIIK